MISVKELIDQISELQGEVWIRQWDYEKDDYSFNQSLGRIDPSHPILNKLVKYIYADDLSTRRTLDSSKPVLFIEVEND